MKLPFLRDLSFPPPPSNPQLEALGAIQFLARANDPEGFVRGTMWDYHRARGSQMYVRSEVSNDLIASDILTPNFGSLKWPSRSMEVYFEDPRIPSMLVQKVSPLDRMLQLAEVGGLGDISKIASKTANPTWKQPAVMVALQNPKHEVLMSMLDDESMNQLAQFDPESIEGLNQHTGAENLLDKEERDAVSWMTNLLFKVLLFASSEGHEPVVSNSRPTKAEGGVIGFKGRPNLARYLIQYLPHQLQIKSKQRDEAMSSHAFRGRRGHWRTYRAERYVNKQHQTDYIYPVPGPDGTYPKVKFVVRKPKDAA